MAYDTFTLTGQHETPTGTAHSGSVVITPNATIRDTTGDVIMSGAIRVPLDENGAWSVVLPCDSAELNPSEGIGYRIGYDLRQTRLEPQSFYATADMAGSTLDVSDIVTVTVPTPLSTVVGPEGPQGPVGPEGPEGPQGETGPQGPIGPNSEFFRHADIRGILGNHESRVILGSLKNAINTASGDASILGGGRDLAENVIGGQEANVNNTAVSNLPADKTIDADYSVIIGGYDNVLNSLASYVAGMHCLIREAAVGGHHAILGGSVHKINAGGYHTIVGGTQNEINATGNASSIFGGEENTVGAAAEHGTIVGGKDNQVTGSYATAVGGNNNTASGSSATVTGGNNNTASGQAAAVVSGRLNNASQIDSTAMGNSSNPSNRGGAAIANGLFAVAGDAQTETFVCRRSTSDATLTTLGIIGGVTPPSIAADTTWLVRGMVVARNTSDAVAESAGWTFAVVVRKGATGNAAIVGTPTITSVGADAGAAAWAVTSITAGVSSFNINVTGEAAKSIRWVARCDVAQVQG